ncbi:MAG: ABC transporter permease subunit [Holophagales bacterium]|nr:ABC transporter permease subunit [Holophagales bacterium]MYG31830.1 ABC transporter permease subunit [Holophagales bacterium]MYI79672.1 ABC transporter permease subunit [Holophagales bacterium]
MNKIVAMAAKDIHILFRDKLGFFFTIFFPLMMAIFFGAMFAGLSRGPASIPIALVDADRTAGSARFVGRLEAAGGLAIERIPGDQALEQVRRGQTAVLVTLRPGFGAALDNPFVATPEVEMSVDPTQFAAAGMVRGVLLEAAGAELQAFMSDPSRMSVTNEQNRRLIEEFSPPSEARDDLLNVLDQIPRIPVLIDEAGLGSVTTGATGGFGPPLEIEQTQVQAQRRGPTNSYATSFAQAMLWTLIGGSVSFSMSIAIERSRGTLMRLLVAPITARQLLAAKGLACLGATLFTSSALITLGITVFGVTPTSYPLLALALLSGSICFCGIMMVLSVIGRTEQAAAGVGWGIALPFTMLGGGMVPLFLMPEWMQTLGNISPMKWTLIAYEGAIWRGFTLSEMLLPCAVLVAIGVLAFSIGATRLRWDTG